jgi:uncharacterized phage protein gp47/JayE
MIQSPTPTSVYQSDLLTALQQTGITQVQPGGKARAFSDMVGNELGNLDSNNYAMIGQVLLPYALGDNLDFIGALFGVYRIQQQNAVVLSSDQNFEFYTNASSFGAINNGNDIVIPAGTQVFSSTNSSSVFATLSTITLSANNEPTFYFAATALTSGAAANTAAYQINATNFSNYTNSRFGSLLVTNNLGIVSGADEESDDNFRYRIALSLQSKNASTQSNLQLAVLAVTGVQDVVFQNQAGTFTAYVYGISPDVGSTLLSAVQAALDQNTAYPLTGLAVAPALVGISFNTTVTFLPNVSLSDQTTALSAASTAAQNYINNLGVGNTFVINDLASAIEGASSNILDIGSANAPIDSIYIWRSRSDGTRYSRTLIANYAPATGERIVVESSISNPIILTSTTS